MHDRDAELRFDVLSYLYQAPRLLQDFIVYLHTRNLRIRMRTVQERNPHGNRADIQVMLFNHADGLCNLIGR
ncbi:hypothetical protein SDC9_145997 [bioreactor metagenome]|uniref:Uncharacterized protein n=1 Tax=bioreactor metagenome TaxID=1076179 RepID=A0A645EA40_9ZZZZ